MKHPRRRFSHLNRRVPSLLPVICAIAVALTAQGAWSQTARTIKIVAPGPHQAASGTTVSRLLGEQIGRAQGLTILIENRTGAGGIIAAEAVSRAAPDGNTLLMMGPDTLIPPHLRKLNYDLLASFEPICDLVNAPTVIAVNGASPYRTLGDLLNAARAKPGDLTMASFGPATAFQIAFEMLKRAANVNMTFLPYPGVAPAINALLGEHVTSVFASYSTASEQLNAGKLRALATARAGTDRASARCADRRRVRLQGLRVGLLARNTGAGQDAEGKTLPTRRLVQSGLAGPGVQDEASLPPGLLSSRDVRFRFCRSSPETIRRIRPRHPRSEHQSGVRPH